MRHAFASYIARHHEKAAVALRQWENSPVVRHRLLLLARCDTPGPTAPEAKEAVRLQPVEGRFACPCCGHLTLEEEPPGTYDICKECGWEDDLVFHDLGRRGGANSESPLEARASYAEYGSRSAPRRPAPGSRSQRPPATGPE
jgi:hypothetical protein